MVSTRKIIVAVAPTGGSLTKDDTRYCPTQPDEIADVVAECQQLGASMAYLHARNPDDSPTCNPEIYANINRLVRQRCDIVINNSTGGGMAGDMIREYGPGQWEVKFSERLKGLDGNADTVTIDTSTLVIVRKGREILFNTTPSQCDALVQGARKRGVKPELMAFAAANIAQDVCRLVKQGYDDPPYMVNITMGFPAQTALPYTPKNLDFMMDLLPPGCIITITGMGETQLATTMHGLLLGANVRVGVEDTIWLTPGKLGSNQDHIKRTVGLARDLGLEIATPAEARAMLGMAPARVA